MDIHGIFENLSSEMLVRWRDTREQENLHLEFKLITSSELRLRDDRKTLAQALSGFANSSGGLVVWGVDARKNEEGIDSVTELCEMDNIDVLIARLNQLTGEAVEPTVNGVMHRAVVTRPGRGFAITEVPESDSGPHMAKLGEDRYYKRSGDSFYRMEHYDIADMFGRRRRPRLAVTVRTEGKGAVAQIFIGLRNEGRASARAPYLAFDCSRPFHRSHWGLDGNCYEGLPFLYSSGLSPTYRYGAAADFVLHPGVTHEIALLWLGPSSARGPDADVQIRYWMSCEDQPLLEGHVTVPLCNFV